MTDFEPYEINEADIDKTIAYLKTIDPDHATPEDAEKYGLQDKQIVSVKIDSNGRSLVFGDVVVRVSPKYALAMHIDTDESNAAGATPGLMGEILA